MGGIPLLSCRMTITVSVPDELLQRAAGQGLSVEAFVEKLAEQAVNEESADAAFRAEEPSRAVDGLLAFRRTHPLTLGRDRAVGLCARRLHDAQLVIRRRSYAVYRSHPGLPERNVGPCSGFTAFRGRQCPCDGGAPGPHPSSSAECFLGVAAAAGSRKHLRAVFIRRLLYRKRIDAGWRMTPQERTDSIASQADRSPASEATFSPTSAARAEKRGVSRRHLSAFVAVSTE